MHGRVAPDLDSTGKVRGLYCTEYDIHDLKQTEQALAAREEQLRLFTDNIPEPVVYLDGERRYVFVNEAFLRLYGLVREEVIGKRPEEVLGAENSLALVAGPRARALQRGDHLRARGRRRDGTRSAGSARAACRTSTTTARSRASTSSATTSATSRTRRTPSRRANRSSARSWTACRRRSPTSTTTSTATTSTARSSSTSASRRSRSRELRLRDVVGHGIYQSAQAMITRALEGESTAFDRLVPGANGVRRWMTIRVVPDAAASGEVHGAFVLMNDIHGLKQAQEALRASEAELRLIMDNVPARVAYIDRDFRFRFINRHKEEWLSERREELTGRRIDEVIGAERARAARSRC